MTQAKQVYGWTADEPTPPGVYVAHLYVMADEGGPPNRIGLRVEGGECNPMEVSMAPEAVVAMADAILSFGYTAWQPVPLLRWFEYSHLPPHLQEVSKPFHMLAHRMVCTLPAGEETDAMLRKLLEAKDCAVRARLSGA